MKLLIVFAITVLAVVASSDDHHEKWSAFKLKHGKTYKNVVEEKLRFNVFQENLRKIEEHNIKYQNKEVGYFLGINKFADQTPEEFRGRLMAHKLTTSELETRTIRKFPENVKLPDIVDWRRKGAVSEIEDQGTCLSYWAFSAVGALEGQNAILNNVTISLSEQELVDCSKEFFNNGCAGGNIREAFQYVKDNGIGAAEDYPYTAQDGSCSADQSKSVIKTLDDYEGVESLNEAALLHAVAEIGPISTYINADLIQLYQGGIFDDYGCLNGQNDLNHAVLAVGYNLTSETNYWILKNSWGPSWGANGYLLLKVGLNICGITWDANYPVLPL